MSQPKEHAGAMGNNANGSSAVSRTSSVPEPKTYIDPAADVVLRSKDGRDFRVHSWMLKASSTKLRERFASGVPAEPILIDAHRPALKLMLDIMHKVPMPPAAIWSKHVELFALCDELGCDMVIELALAAFPACVERDPWRMFCVASERNNVALARAALSALASAERRHMDMAMKMNRDAGGFPSDFNVVGPHMGGMHGMPGGMDNNALMRQAMGMGMNGMHTFPGMGSMNPASNQGFGNMAMGSGMGMGMGMMPWSPASKGKHFNGFRPEVGFDRDHHEHAMAQHHVHHTGGKKKKRHDVDAYPGMTGDFDWAALNMIMNKAGKDCDKNVVALPFMVGMMNALLTAASRNGGVVDWDDVARNFKPPTTMQYPEPAHRTKFMHSGDKMHSNDKVHHSNDKMQHSNDKPPAPKVETQATKAA